MSFWKVVGAVIIGGMIAGGISGVVGWLLKKLKPAA
jgi:hypothetical protein